MNVLERVDETMIEGFTTTGLPQMSYGRGGFLRLDQHLLAFGSRALLISDGYIKDHPSLFDEMSECLKKEGLSFEHLSVLSTNTHENAEEILKKVQITDFDSVVSIGGGRAIDVAKLVSRGLPHIAIPTTAGTGAAMNGVIFGGESAHQETHLTQFLPNLVLADPAFIDDMGRVDFAARALGVFNLLLEAYVSPKSSILSDAFVWSGLESFARGFVQGLDGDLSARDDVFYASLMAGAGAGQAGFGLTHRLACVIEYKSSLSYAQASATLCAEICDLQIQLLSDFLPDHRAMDKYALVGELLAGRPFEACEEAYASLIGTLRRWVARLELPKIQLSEDELMDICTDISADWDEGVMPLRISEDDLLDSLLRRSL